MRSALARLLFGVVCITALTVGCGDRAAAMAETGAAGQASSGPAEAGWRDIHDLTEARFGILTGTVWDRYVLDRFPQAQLRLFNRQADLILALRTRKVDAVLLDLHTLQVAAAADPTLAILDDDFYDTDLGVGFRKDDDALRRAFNAFLVEIRADGTYDAMRRRWHGGASPPVAMPEIPLPERGQADEDEALLVGMAPVLGFPMVYVVDGGYAGFDIELIRRFAAHQGRPLTLVPLEFDGLIAALQAGKVDLIISNISITEERARLIDFSEPYLQDPSGALVRVEDLAAPVAAGSGAAASGPTTAANAADLPGSAGPGWSSMDDLADKRIAVLMGTIWDDFIARTYPRANIVRLKSTADIIAAVETGKADAALLVDTTARLILKQNTNLAILADDLLDMPLGIGFSRSRPDLRERFNRFLADIRADGSYDAIAERWLQNDPEQAEMPQIPRPASGERVRLGVAVADLPYLAVVNGDYAGFDMEILRRFAAREGLQLDITTYEFDALVAALASGKADIIADGIAISEERARMVDFSDPYTDMRTVALVRARDMAGHQPPPAVSSASASWSQRLWGSIERTLITEGRWRLILDGILITVVISVLSTLFGTLLGALVCAMRLSANALLQRVARVYIELVRGIPVLVLLMLIFYVAFASVNIAPLIVAVIAFGLNFAAYVSEMFRTGIESVGRGQREAGIALGFTRVQTFLHIVLPQATRQVLPVYRGEFMSLVKMTAIVGYIGIQDLTRAGDIIRSRTFEAFFPMVLIAAIYFVVIWLLGLALDHVERRTDPRARRAARSRA
ncbi:ABC transporter substrate-binding protein/permease [Thiohalocapsa marina]|nr:ABC transporter substrate-binding protein/permease [Thiohalocapsa marina]